MLALLANTTRRKGRERWDRLPPGENPIAVNNNNNNNNNNNKTSRESMSHFGL
jgi:hypothetical protein